MLLKGLYQICRCMRVGRLRGLRLGYQGMCIREGMRAQCSLADDGISCYILEQMELKSDAVIH